MPGFFLIDGVAYPAALAPGLPPEGATVAAAGDHVWVHLDGRIVELVWQDALSHFAEESEDHGQDHVRAPMPGSVIAVAVAPGDRVARGDTMMVIESMKLETVIRAPRDGTVETVAFAVGRSFERDALLVALEPAA